ncbi:DUF4352 domain-containing protein [Fictibacillus nanhaiensis]|uniref:DUF4352 domain-containing protein n=1 Tax=Fictibacillus nanhaiensis TaxID=742169 RepID=UPI001C94A840|nr:DUF4352 domain-containing protein [Fictibacillus nanhaiensis]MBY6037469.1 DUF4352 domain-containing protein [Fictibacillus nanhaiensis]
MLFKGWIILGLTAALVTGCSTDSSDNKEKKQTQQEEPNESAKNEEVKGFDDSPQAPDDSDLTEKNKTFEDADGIITLKQIAQVNEEKQTGPLSLKIADVKVLHYKPSVDLIDFFHGFTHHEVEFPYVRVNVVLKNTSKETVHFAPVSELKTNQGETVTWEEDFYLENLNGDLKPGEEKVGSLGFIIDETDPEKLKEITLKSSEVIDSKKKKIADSLSFKIEF